MWKILQEKGIPDHFACLLRNLHEDKKQQLELDMEQRTGSNLGKEYGKAVHSHLAYLTYMQSTSYDMLGWMTQDCRSKHQQYQICIWYHFNGKKRRGTKEAFDESERGEWKTWLKTQHSKNEDHGILSLHGKYMAKKQKQCQISFSWVPKSMQTVTAAAKLKHLLLGRIALTNLDSILQSRDITLPTEVRLVKAMLFPVSHVPMWELDHKEDWGRKNGCFWILVL